MLMDSYVHRNEMKASDAKVPALSVLSSPDRLCLPGLPDLEMSVPLSSSGSGSIALWGMLAFPFVSGSLGPSGAFVPDSDRGFKSTSDGGVIGLSSPWCAQSGEPEGSGCFSDWNPSSLKSSVMSTSSSSESRSMRTALVRAETWGWIEGTDVVSEVTLEEGTSAGVSVLG